MLSFFLQFFKKNQFIQKSKKYYLKFLNFKVKNELQFKIKLTKNKLKNLKFKGVKNVFTHFYTF